MSKTKFTKVAVSERLPENDGRYLTENGWLDYKKNVGWLSFLTEFYPKYWMEESPDREDEMQQVADEREVMIKAFSDVTKEFEGRKWITEGRGPYTYDDEGYRKEVTYLFKAFEKIKSEMWSNIKSKTFEYKNQVEAPFLKREDEMRELLENLKNEVDWTYNAWNGTKGAYYKYKIEQFLTPKN